LRLLLRVMAYAVLTAWAACALLPLYWMVSTSLKSASVVMKMPPEWFPAAPTLENYRLLFRRAAMARWFLNSALVAAVHTMANLLTASMAGYAFAKKQFPGDRAIFWMLLATIMIPGMVLLAPLFLLIARMGLIDTYAGLMLPGLVTIFGIFLMKQFIQTLPNELIDAARVDGASEWGIYWHVVLPLSRPGLAVLGIFSFMGAWNDFLWPLLVTQSKSMRTLPVGLATLQQESVTDYGLLMAGACVAALPMIAIFLLLQRHFLKGLTLGAVKG
jgi:multiple sugar transport system permease protein